MRFSIILGQSLLCDRRAVAHDSPLKPVLTKGLQVMELAGCDFGGLTVAGSAAWQDESAGLLGVRHDDTEPGDYRAGVG